MTIGNLLGAMKRHLKSMIAIFISTIIVVMAITLIIPPKYTATSKIVAMPQQANGVGTNVSYISAEMQNYLQIITSEKTLQPVIKDLGLQKSTQQLAPMIKTSNPTGTQTIVVTVTDLNGQEAADIANAITKYLPDAILAISGIKDKAQLPVSFKTIQTAAVPSSPSSPSIKRNLVVAIFFGLGLDLATAFVLEALRKKFTVIDEVSSFTKLPAFGLIPDSEDFDNQEPILVRRPESSSSEEIRTITSKVELSLDSQKTENHGKILVITSSMPDEGSTTASINIATAMAETGRHVLLIEAELRSPSMAERLGIDSQSGLSDVLNETQSLSQAITSYWKPNLHVLPAGERPYNPSALLNSALMIEILEQSREHYDYVVVDTTSAEISSDAVNYSKIADGTVIVVSCDQVETKELNKTVKTLRVSSKALLGFIFNKDKSGTVESKNKFYSTRRK